MKKTELKEVSIPDNILAKLEASAEAGQPITLGQAGVFDWLNGLSDSEGWRPVWLAFRYPFFVLEREIEKS